MSLHLSTRAIPLGSITTLRLVSLVERMTDSFAAWRKARGTATALRELSDRGLADIGLSRGAIAILADKLAYR
jgi:uncharacterized protein YjiS (DUF1127 family)